MSARSHYPATLTQVVTQSAANALSSTEVSLPVVRVPSSGRVTIVELRSIKWGFASTTTPTAVDGENICVGISTASLDSNPAANLTPLLIMTDPTTVWFDRHACRVVTSGGAYLTDIAWQEQLLDHDGHGILVATDSIFFHVYTAAFAIAHTIVFKLGYSFVDVGLSEYIGIVQSQNG